MSPSHRSLQVILLAALLAGCGVEPTPKVTPTPSGAPSASTASPAPATATASASSVVPSVSPSVIPSPSPTGTPRVSPSPPGKGGFVTAIPPDPAETWKGIRWRKVAASNPLAHVRSVTRWRGGFVATGDLVVTGGSARNKVWVSADGGTWNLLGAGVFGPKAMVIGVAGTAEGVVALTLQSGAYSGNGSRNELESWSMTGPWQTWTSSDGRAWTAHPGPAFTVPSVTGDHGARPTLLAGAGNDLLALALGGQPLAFSRNGIIWETASLDAFPGGPTGWKATALVAFPPGFVAVGSTPTKDVALASADGRAWTTLPATCPAGDLIVGPAGLILSFEVEGLDKHFPQTMWCSSLDGRSWRTLPNLPPLGYSQASDECRGICPNGILLGNGERMLAYRGYPKQAGWTSFDGRTWKPLTFSGSRPTGWDAPNGYQFTTILTPIGLVFINSDNGSAWYGQPLT